jgi:putative ABC transport system permease protein
MFRSYLAAAWRSARRDRFYAMLNVLGLGLGFAAAILIGLYVRDEYSYDRFLPGYRDVYQVQLTFADSGRGARTSRSVPAVLAEAMTLDFPEIARAVRVTEQSAGLRHGEIEATEEVQVADADFFAVLGFPLLAGDPATALTEPDSIVLTRRLALKYFGTVDCLGETLDLDHVHTVRVTGIAEDPQTNTTVGFPALLSGKSPYSAIAEAPQQADLVSVLTYLRLKPSVPPETLMARLPGFTLAHFPQPDGLKPLFTIFLKPLADAHLHPNNPDTAEIDSKAETVHAVAATGLLILLLAGINFVNLVTARATRRALEVGVRKALGGMRHQLMIQFMAESVAYALAGMVLGTALAELGLPSLNSFLDRQIAFDYWHQPLLAVVLVVTGIVLGLIAGFYPALVLSSFPPAKVLKSRAGGQSGGGRLRLALVVFQFTVTIGLVISTAVIYRQNVFAASGALGFDKDLVLTVDLSSLLQPNASDGVPRVDSATLDALHTQFAGISGVQAVAGSWAVPAPSNHLNSGVHRRDQVDRPDVSLALLPVDFGFFDLYRLGLIAGRDFARDHAEDNAQTTAPSAINSAIINDSAVRALGFTDAAAAIGQDAVMGSTAFRIIGVAPDFPLDSVRQKVPPSIFFVSPDLF